MFLGKKFQFRCDICGLEQFVEIFPKNWIWIKPAKGEAIAHACEKCKELVPAERHRKGGQKT